MTRELGQAAVALRGSIEPADFRRYVLPTSLRFLSLRFERRREELHRPISEPATEYHTTSARVADRVLADLDE